MFRRRKSLVDARRIRGQGRMARLVCRRASTTRWTLVTLLLAKNRKEKVWRISAGTFW